MAQRNVPKFSREKLVPAPSLFTEIPRLVPENQDELFSNIVLVAEAPHHERL